MVGPGPSVPSLRPEPKSLTVHTGPFAKPSGCDTTPLGLPPPAFLATPFRFLWLFSPPQILNVRGAQVLALSLLHHHPSLGALIIPPGFKPSFYILLLAKI